MKFFLFWWKMTFFNRSKINYSQEEESLVLGQNSSFLKRNVRFSFFLKLMFIMVFFSFLFFFFKFKLKLQLSI